MMSTDKPTIVVFVLGGPGSGKGTQCGHIARDFGFVHLSAGDLLRAQRNDPLSEHGMMINTCIKEGKIVPSEVTVTLIKNEMERSHSNLFLIDGFPRNQENKDAYDAIIGDTAILAFLLNFICPEEVIVDRLLARNEGRVDDNIDSIRKRLVTFYEQTEPVIDVYRAKGKVIDVDTSRDVDTVYRDIHMIISTLVSIFN